MEPITVIPLGCDSIEFAKNALCRVSNIAANVGARQISPDAGCLAAKLWLAAEALDTPDPNKQRRIERRLPKLLVDLGSVCSWPERSDQQRNGLLKTLIYPETYIAQKKAEEKVRQGITSFMAGPAFAKGQYFANLDRFFGRDVASAPDRDQKPTKPENADPDEYPPHVNWTFYSVLMRYSACTCGNGTSAVLEQHAIRLRLRAKHTTLSRQACFDLFFSSAPLAWAYWQAIQLRVPMSKTRAKTVRYRDDADSVPSMERARVIEEGGLCDIVSAQLGSRICFKVHDSVLHQLHEGFPITQHVAPRPSVSLGRVLETHRLSNKMKLVLSCIVARSFWQYYDSPWMSSPWTSDLIHFLVEAPPNEHADSTSGIFACRPYVVVDFSTPRNSFSEYSDAFSLIYRYPRLLALCLILIEIGRGSRLNIDAGASLDATMNRQWEVGRRVAEDPKPWGDFHYPEYRAIVRRCLQSKTFIAQDIAKRRWILYETVIRPLEQMVKLLGYSDAMETIEPIDSRGPGPVMEVPQAVPLADLERTAASLQDGAAAESQMWLARLTMINQSIRLRSQNSSAAQTPSSVRIAILDTGYDDETIFFQVSARRHQLKDRWKDFAANSETPVDENGHGTHTLALLMKVAPFADIHVARIAKDRDGLREAGDAIAKAIRWAVHECKADIISMSFGFNDEIPAISDAIWEAQRLRRDKILFFAAAANSGGNQREMFPARHDSVVSIRETNPNGFFSDTNPPVDRDGPAVYGTLGRDVPSAWLRTVEGEVVKSGSSVATAVAAGIAAMTLAYATTCLPGPGDVARLWTRRGMLRMFAKMSENMGNRCFFLSPARILLKDETSCWAAMIDACSC